MQMYFYEGKAAELGFKTVCGVDEAGCGPLAGPVFAGAVVLNPSSTIDGLDDSKKLSEKRREALYEQIKSNALCWHVAMVEEAEIDRLNILQARLAAMRMAVDGLKIKADYALIDGDRDPGLGIDSLLIVKGDQQSASIAAASIMAKVSRDRHMLMLAKAYPQYQFERHKGYGTKQHYEMLDRYGISPVHRKSFLKKYISGKINNEEPASG